MYWKWFDRGLVRVYKLGNSQSDSAADVLLAQISRGVVMKRKEKKEGRKKKKN